MGFVGLQNIPYVSLLKVADARVFPPLSSLCIEGTMLPKKRNFPTV